MRRPLSVIAGTVVLTLASTTSWAYWSGTSTTGGTGAAAATSVNAGATPSASAVGSTVTVTWSASTLATGTAVGGYLVKRYNASTLVVQTILSACTGTVAATSCVESNVPDGSWKYTVTPVFATNWQGAESAKSATVTVDGTAPTSSISLSSVTGGAYLSGTTLYYRGTAAGSLSLTNAVSDAGSGPASSSTAALTGTTTGWTHTPSTVSTPSGGPYVSNTFSWTAGTTSGPGEAVTGRDVSANAAVTNLTFANDSTAPTAGTITYADGFASAQSASISFTAGTDSASGIATRQLQRAQATQSGGSCGTFSSFSNIGADSPTSPYVDSSLAVGCYQYRYVVTDRVGNQDIATSANVVKVSYAGAVSGTSGLLSQWRLGDDASSAQIASDTFTGTAGTLLTAHTGELAASWTRQSGTADEAISDTGRVYRASGSGGYTLNTASLTPVNADYTVEADVVLKSTLSGDMIGLVGRLTSANTYYLARWEQFDGSWNLAMYYGGYLYYLDYVTGQTLTVGQSYHLKFEMIGSSIKLYVDGVLKASATDSSITASGKAGLMDGDRESGGTNTGKSNTTGIHLDNFSVTTTYRAQDSKSTNHGGYVNGVTRGVTGAIAASTDTAASFDGVNDYVQMTGTTGFPVGSASRSVEAWFKTTSSARQVLWDYGSLASTQEFGLWIEAGGATMDAWGWGNGNDKIFTMPSAVNNGAWHQVVLTYNGTTLTLYIDGVALPTQAATRATVMDSYGFSIGAVVNPGDANSGGYFNGSIDEVSFYTSVLSQATVTEHYQLGTAAGVDGTGPTGGSVDATGLVGTGSRYSTSTSLSLALAKGTDPSGLAGSGNQVLRATATLTNGTCGSYGSYTLVATDPATPLSDTVSDQACYSYQYVVSDALGNATTYTSPNIKVDSTAPAAPTLAFSAFTNTWWPGSGSTVYYRSAATPGSFTATATATDAAAGIASYTFPSLGTNWTSTPGSLGVNTYSWSGSPAAPGTKNVTATNNAGLASGNGSFTMTADDTAPSSGTVTYANTTQTSTSVSVSFTAGTDGGSGLGTRLLQRASATLTGTTCGSYGAFATVSGGTNPTSPFTDTVTSGSCYMYQYVVSDNVGNTTTATSANVVKVSANYLATVLATAGLLNYYRLGEAVTSADSMTGTAGTTLQSHTGETAASWTTYGFSDANAVLTSAGRLRKNGTSTTAFYYASAVPASADYTVGADLYVASTLSGDMAGLVGRVDPSSAFGTYYYVRYEQVSQSWSMFSVVNNGWSYLGGAGQTLTAGSTYRVSLAMSGTTIKLVVDGVEKVSVTDSSITAAGRGGILLGTGAQTTDTDTTGYQLDNFQITPPAADSKGTNTGTYLGGVTLGTTGAINGDANTAATFDGSNDFTSVARQISDDFSIEFWFKSTQGIGTNAQWWGGAGLVDGEVSGSTNDFGVSLRSDGKVVAGIGTPDVSIVSTSGGYNNGAWHHVVFTRTKATGALALYIDGAAAGTATGASTASLTAPAYLNFGRIQSGANYLVGSLDEVAIYSSVLSSGTASAHNSAGQ